MGSEPYTLRGIPSKGVQALMTRLSPAPEEGPGAQPHIGGTPNMTVSEFSVHTHYRDESQHQGSSPSVIYSGTMCSIERRTNPSDRAVAPVIHTVFYQPVQYCKVSKQEEDNF